MKKTGLVISLMSHRDALQRVYDRKIISRDKIEHGLGRVVRNISDMLGVRCALRFMPGYEDQPL